MSGTRTLTVVFTDIVASTELWSTLDARESERLLTAHFTVLRDEIVRFGGTEIKNLGDGLMITFDSAQGAIGCGIAMQRACAAPPPGATRRVPIRVGISTGDVRTDGGDCFGTAVVEASRLCASAVDGQVIASNASRLLARDYHELTDLGELVLKGLPELVRRWQAEWSSEIVAALRVVIADDAALVREGVARLLEEAGLEVVGQAGDAVELLAQTADLLPDVAVVDVRMPPSHTTEGLEAAATIRSKYPQIGVLVLSQDIQPSYAARLLAASETHVGYLLKERVSRLSDFADAVRSVAAGGTAFEPSIVSSAIGVEPGEGAIRSLTPAEARLLAAQVAV